MQVISVQSRVAHGYVGNAAAVPAYQAFGIDAWPVDTVRLAHHPGHPTRTGGPAGSRTPPDEVAAVLAGVFDRIGPATVAVHLGYLGSAETGRRVLAEIERRRRAGVQISLIVDPVLGDDAEGIYVEEALIGFYRDEALPHADIVLPNRFELELLAGASVIDAAAAVGAARSFIRGRRRTILVSSLPAGAERIGNLAIEANAAWIAEVPKRPIRAKGTGDLLGALFAARLILGESARDALSGAVGAVDAAVRAAFEADADEIPLAAARNALAGPMSTITASPLAIR